jgi:hypothetical protein
VGHQRREDLEHRHPRAQYDLIFARTSGKAGDGDGITAFLVPTDAPGFEVEEYLWTFNMPTDHAHIRSPTCGSPTRRSSAARAEGLQVVQHFFNENRIRQAASSLGAAQFCIDQSVEYAKHRRPFGKPLATNQAIQFPLVELQTQCEMLRALIHKTAWQMDTYGAFSVSDKVSMCNYWANRLCCEAADRAMQVHGGLGYSRHKPFEHIYRHHRRYRITEGAEEIQMRRVAGYLFGFMSQQAPKGVSGHRLLVLRAGVALLQQLELPLLHRCDIGVTAVGRQQLLDPAELARRVLPVGPGPGDGDLEQVVGTGELVGEAHLDRLAGVDHPARQHEVRSHAEPDPLGDEVAAGELGDQPHLDEPQAEAGRLGRDDPVERQDHRQPDTDGDPVHGGHQRLGGADQLHPVPATLGPGGLGVALQLGAEGGLDVCPGAEAPSGAGDHDGADGGIGVRRLDGIGQLGTHRRRPGVEPLGSVQRQHHDVIVLLSDDLLVGHGVPSRSR